MIHDSKDESALGLAAVGIVVVVMASILGVLATQSAPAGPGEYRTQHVEQTPAEHGVGK